MLRALAPLLIAVAAALAAGLLGLTRESPAGTALEPYVHGLFAERYPLFAFAILYGLARIAVEAAWPGPRRILRAGLGLLGATLFLAACLHPTFGGLVLRSGFFSGGMSFLNGQTLTAAYLIGCGVAALVFGLALGTATVLARGQIVLTRRSLARALGSYLALWLGGALIAAPRALGWPLLADWPAAPLAPAGALAAAGLVAAALLPHALWAWVWDRGLRNARRAEPIRQS